MIQSEILQQLLVSAGVSHDHDIVIGVHATVSRTAAEDLSPLLQLSSLRQTAQPQTIPVLGVLKFKWFSRSRTASCVLSDGKRKVRCALSRPCRALHGSLILVSSWRVTVVNKTIYMDALKWEALTSAGRASFGPEATAEPAVPGLSSLQGTVAAVSDSTSDGTDLHVSVDGALEHLQQVHIRGVHTPLLAALAWLHPGVDISISHLERDTPASLPTLLHTTRWTRLQLGNRTQIAPSLPKGLLPDGCLSLRAVIRAISERGILLTSGDSGGVHEVGVFWNTCAPRLPWNARPGSTVSLFHLAPQAVAGRHSQLLHFTWTPLSFLFVHTCGEPPAPRPSRDGLTMRPFCSPMLFLYNVSSLARAVGCAAPFAAGLLCSEPARAALTLQSTVYASSDVLEFVGQLHNAPCLGPAGAPHPLQVSIHGSSSSRSVSMSLPAASGLQAVSPSDAWLATVLRVDFESGRLYVGSTEWQCQLLVAGVCSAPLLDPLRHCSKNEGGLCVLLRSPRIHAFALTETIASTSSADDRASLVRTQAQELFSIAGKARRAIAVDDSLADTPFTPSALKKQHTFVVSCGPEDIVVLAKLQRATPEPPRPRIALPAAKSLPPFQATVIEPAQSRSVQLHCGSQHTRTSLFVAPVHPVASIPSGQPLLLLLSPEATSLAFAQQALPGDTVDVQPMSIEPRSLSAFGDIVHLGPSLHNAVAASRRGELRTAVDARFTADLAALQRVFASLCDIDGSLHGADDQDLQLCDFRGIILDCAADVEQSDATREKRCCRLKLLSAAGATLSLYLKHQGMCILPPLLPGSIVAITCLRRLISSSSAAVYAATTAASTFVVQAVDQRISQLVVPSSLPFTSCGALLRGGGNGLDPRARRLRVARVRCVWFELDASTEQCTSQWIVVDGTGESILRSTGSISWLLCGLPPHRRQFWLRVARQLMHLTPTLTFSTTLMNADLKQFLLSAQHFMADGGSTSVAPCDMAALRRNGHSRLCRAALLSLQHLKVDMCTDVEESVGLLSLEVTLAALHGITVPAGGSTAAPCSPSSGTADWVWLDTAAKDTHRAAWSHEVDVLARQTFHKCTSGAGGSGDGAAELQWRAGCFLGAKGANEPAAPPQPSRAAQVTIAPRRGGGNVSTSTRAMPRVNLTALAARSLLPKDSLRDSLAYLSQQIKA